MSGGGYAWITPVGGDQSLEPVSVLLDAANDDFVAASPTISSDAIDGGSLDGWPWLNSGGVSGLAETESGGLEWDFNRTGFNSSHVGFAHQAVPRLEFPDVLVGVFTAVFGISSDSMSGPSNAWALTAGWYDSGDEHHVGIELDGAVANLIAAVGTTLLNAATIAASGAPTVMTPTTVYLRLKRVGEVITAGYSTDNATWTEQSADIDVAGYHCKIALHGWTYSGFTINTTHQLTYVSVTGNKPSS